MIRDLDRGTFSSLYIIAGDETYEKELILKKLKKSVIDPAFSDFNLIEFDGKKLMPEDLLEAVDSYPAMSEKKLIIVQDFDLYKAPVEFSEMLPTLLNDLPEYVCLVFYYDIVTFKQDNRKKTLSNILNEKACLAHFDRLGERELTAWIEKKARDLGRSISPNDAKYLIFLCGNDKNNLLRELTKAALHSTTGEIRRYNIDSVCSPTLEANVFRITDEISNGNYNGAIKALDELMAQKFSPVHIFGAVSRHIQRMYGAKLCETNPALLAKLINSSSNYYIHNIQKAAKIVSLDWLRQAASICAQTDTELKGSAVNPQQQIELALLTLAAIRKGERKK